MWMRVRHPAMPCLLPLILYAGGSPAGAARLA